MTKFYFSKTNVCQFLEHLPKVQTIFSWSQQSVSYRHVALSSGVLSAEFEPSTQTIFTLLVLEIAEFTGKYDGSI